MFFIILSLIIGVQSSIPECFKDCYDTTYTGIRSASKSGKICKSNPNFCRMTNNSIPSCMTDVAELSCSVPHCSQSDNNIFQCVTIINYKTTLTKIKVEWSDTAKIYAYIVLLYNEDNLCERSVYQKCDFCSEYTFNTEFFSSCQSIKFVSKLTYETTFDNLHHNKEYTVYVVSVTNDKVQDVLKLPIKTKSQECFKDCYDSEYFGIRSITKNGNVCTPWKDVSISHTNSNFCTMKGKDQPWCFTNKWKWEYCEVTKCKNPKEIENRNCDMEIDFTTTSSNVVLNWIQPSNVNDVYGYVALLYNNETTCESSILQCNRCNISWYIMGFMLFCKSKPEFSKITNKHVFNNLKQNTEYTVYVLTIFKLKLYQNVNKMIVKTKCLELEKPSNVAVIESDSQNLSFKWDIPNNIKEIKKEYYFMVTLTKSTYNKIIQNITKEVVEFSGLESCSKYCLDIVLVVNDGQSDPSETVCAYTESPTPEIVNINDVGIISSLTAIVSWKYSGNKDCSVFFEVEYGLKDDYVSIYEKTNYTNILLNNLDEDKIYRVRVRAKNTVVDSNIQSGPYSERKVFNVISEKPLLEKYNEIINSLGTNVQISWTYNKYNKVSIFEYFVIFQDSNQHCLMSVNITCSSCKESRTMMNVENMKIIKESYACKKMKQIYFEKNNSNFTITLNKEKKVKTFNIIIFAVTSEKVHKVLSKNTYGKDEETALDKYSDYLDIESVFDTFYTRNITKYGATTKDSFVKVLRRDNVMEKTSFQCFLGKLINFEVEIVNNGRIIKVPFNTSCGMKNPTNIISNLTNKCDTNNFHISWQKLKTGSQKYIIYWMNNEKHFFKYIDSELTSYFLNTVKKLNWQQICIATIDHKYRTSKYSCIECSLYPEPVVNFRVHSTSKEVYAFWEKSMNGIHHGYVINVTLQDGHCQTTVINMEPHCVKIKQSCRYKINLQWKFLKSFQIKNLSPDTKCQISISSVRGSYISRPIFIMTKTKREESVSNLKIISFPSNIFIEFTPPKSAESIDIEYRLKVILHGMNMCTFKYKVIYDDVIKTTFKNISVHYYLSCFKYEMEIVPIYKCNMTQTYHNFSISEVEYIPLRKEGFFNNAKSDLSNLRNINVNLLSKKLLKVSWDYDFSMDECNNFGLMVDIVNTMKESDCKTWIISRTTCTTMIEDLDIISKCKNKQYRHYNTNVIKSTLLSHGDFNTNTSYTVNVWLLRHEVIHVLTKEVTYNYEGACFYNCQKSEIFSNEECLVTNQDWNKATYINYENNLCKFDSIKTPFCFHKGVGHEVNCNTTTCNSSDNYLNCSNDIVIKSSTQSITVNLSKYLFNNLIKGYIIALYDANQTCITYVKINISNSKIQEEALLSSCQSNRFRQNLVNEIIFKDLTIHHEYIIYVFLYVGNNMFGVTNKLTVATTFTDREYINYIKTTHRGNTSLTFSWNSYKEKSDKRHFNHYMINLVNMRSNEELFNITTKEMKTFTNLEICTKYCIYLTIIYEKSLLELIDSTCTDTLSSSLGLLTLNDIKSGPSLSRTISWAYSGNDDCSKNYRVELYNKRLNLTTYSDTQATNVDLPGLIKDQLYRVRVRIEPEQLQNDNLDNDNYSEMKVFFTGEVIQSVMKIRLLFDSNSNNITFFLKLYLKTPSRIYEIILQIKNKRNYCLKKILFTPEEDIGDYKSYLSKNIKNSWENHKKCDKITEATYSGHIIDYEIPYQNVYANPNMTVLGLSVFGIETLYKGLMKIN